MIIYDLPPPFDQVWFRFACGLAVGSALGSFGTVLAYRLPRGLSIIAPRSHCPACGTTLQARDLVPILSWLAAQGKCRHCQAVIGWRYLWIEVGCGFVVGAAGAALPLFWPH